MRLTKKIAVKGHSVKIYRNAAYGEFVVRTTFAGGGEYFTGDRADARATAASIIRQIRKSA